MKVSVDWIADFAEIPDGVNDRELTERITMGVCEVEGYERHTVITSHVIVAEVKATTTHPNAKDLTLATVGLGAGKEATVVCGAPNCRPSIKVPYAATGTRLPNGVTLESKRIRGVLSDGMLLAEDELGLSDRHDGLMELAEDAPVGALLSEVLGGVAASDLVLEIDNKSLTHRPDCWGHYGLAREFAAALGTRFTDSFDEAWANDLRARVLADGGESPVSLHVDRDSANRGFLSLSMDGVIVGESPVWMQRRLHIAGMRPINTIVDISNYVMIETGMPNHIFDRRSIRDGKIVVRRAGRETEFTTLDGQVRKIIASDTLVCDGQHEMAIAGVMGGLESSVAADTTQIVIEVANWTDSDVRRTSTRLGLRTDASQRYEKSLDSQQLEKCLLRIYELVRALCPRAKAIGPIQCDNMPAAVERTIQTSASRISAVLGTTVTEERQVAILEALGFKVEQLPGVTDGETSSGKTYEVHVPSWRSTKDVECEADIVEEIGRIIGYDNIAPVSPSHTIEPLRLSTAKTLFRKAQDFLVLRARCLEVMTYPLVGETLLKKAAWPVRNESLVLTNALTPDRDRMRPSLIPSLLQATADNRRFHEAFRIFECGRAYAELAGEGFSSDLHQIGIVFQEQSNPFVELADVVEELLSYLGLPARIVAGDPDRGNALVPAAWAGTHPHEFLCVEVMGRSHGAVLSVHPEIGRKFRIGGRTALAVVDLTDMMSPQVKEPSRFRPLDRYPGSLFDVTVVMPSDAYAEAAVSAVRRLQIREIRSTGVLDVFAIDDERKAVTLRVEFRDRQKTLTADSLKGAEERVIAALESEGYLLRR